MERLHRHPYEFGDMQTEIVGRMLAYREVAGDPYVYTVEIEKPDSKI